MREEKGQSFCENTVVYMPLSNKTPLLGGWIVKEFLASLMKHTINVSRNILTLNVSPLFFV